MKAKEFVSELIGSQWEEHILPYLLESLKRSMLDAQRYDYIRDYAKNMSFNEEPRSRVEMHKFDAMLDARRMDD